MDYLNIILLGSFIIVFYFFFIRANSKEKEKKKNFLENLKRGDKVVMISGLCGYFCRFEDNKVVVETDERGHKLIFLKNAISIEETQNIQEKTEEK